MTLIPGVALIALLINNLLLKVPLLMGFPFYLAYLGVRRVVTRRRGEH